MANKTSDCLGERGFLIQHHVDFVLRYARRVTATGRHVWDLVTDKIVLASAGRADSAAGSGFVGNFEDAQVTLESFGAFSTGDHFTLMEVSFRPLGRPYVPSISGDTILVSADGIARHELRGTGADAMVQEALNIANVSFFEKKGNSCSAILGNAGDRLSRKNLGNQQFTFSSSDDAGLLRRGILCSPKTADNGARIELEFPDALKVAIEQDPNLQIPDPSTDNAFEVCAVKVRAYMGGFYCDADGKPIPAEMGANEPIRAQSFAARLAA
ncbi:MAG: hypothetical protein JNK72_24750 [Myxococcales bacterium]|nr:hypothetical protein [Myxococcales bacterium]